MEKELENYKKIKVKREFSNNNDNTLEKVLVEILENKIKSQPYTH